MTRQITNSKRDDLAYWQERKGQFRWRLDERYRGVRQMEADIAECDQNIKRLREDAEGDNKKCHADRDGECSWRFCPQTRDGEPKKSSRSCPYCLWGDDE